jgi:hypothetical protein
MKRLLGVAGLLATLGLAGCMPFPPTPYMAPLIIDAKGPVAVGDSTAASNKVGRAEAQCIVLFGWGDASITEACKKAQPSAITKINHVDFEQFSALGFYSKYTTVVYGN